MSLIEWSWLFLVIYIIGMLCFGWVASRRIANADDFATARSSYGPYFLALAFAATTASGATFLGSPGLGYEFGMASVWGKFLYPMGVYFGVLITIRLVATSGHRFGNRSIPEYLGDRYRSDGVRLLVSVFSLVLFFYITGQLVSGLVMFETMLGLEPMTALVITSAVLLVYVVLGGAHADIITDGVQGLMMLGVAIMVIVMFLFASGVDGGLGGLVDRLRSQDENLVGALNRSNSLYDSWWAIIAVLFAHIPLGMLPHIGNKVWALKHDGDRMRFVKLAFAVGLTMGMLGLGGILARGVLGPELLEAGRSANEALPALFIELFPTWLAALIGVGGACRDHVNRGRAHRVFLPDRCQRHLPALDRAEVQRPPVRCAGGPSGAGDQPMEHGHCPGAVHGNGLGDAGHEHCAAGLDGHRWHDGGLCRPACARCLVAGRDPGWRRHRPH